MRRTFSALALLLGSIAFAGCLDLRTGSEQGAIESGCQASQVEICHVPPGDPDSAHTICIGAPAVDAHVAHGDYPGACDDGSNTCAQENESCVTDDDCCLDANNQPMFCDAGNRCARRT